MVALLSCFTSLNYYSKTHTHTAPRVFKAPHYEDGCAALALAWPAEVCVVFTERTLVLKVQLCPTLRVQSPEHLDEDILQDGGAWVWTHADVRMTETVTDSEAGRRK